MPAVVLDEVTAVRGERTVWSHGNVEIPPGGVIGVIGPNGSGKTTLLLMLLGLVAPAAGRVEVLGAAPRRGNREIGYVPQRYTAEVGDAMRCRDLVALAATGTRLGPRRMRDEDRARVDAALAAVDAAGYADQRLSRLSGGQQQRVAIAQALVDDPRLLLLDEPLANLDLRNQHETVAVLRRLHAEREPTILIVAHDLNVVLPLLTGAIYLLDGHAHYAPIGEVVDEGLLTHLYGTPIQVVRTAQGDLFTRGG